MTLSGVLKDILLVIASMVIFFDPVSPLQAFGYSIALGGLIYFKLGGEKIKGYLAEGQRSWTDYGARHPIMRKTIIFGTILLIFFVVFGSVAPAIAPEYNEYAKQKLAGATKLGGLWNRQ
jgi:hypothetical protein